MDVEQAIRLRKTEKVLADDDLPVRQMRTEVAEMLSIAGMAPFHRACEDRHRTSDLAGIEPWRFHALDAMACRQLKAKLPTENAGKIPAMLAAADALIMTTWLPNAGTMIPLDDEAGFVATLANVEHIAAASAAIQNLLLTATARGIRNYWSSGGVLREPTVFAMLGIPAAEILLGAIFLFPNEIGSAELAESKLRSKRMPLQQWSRWIEL